MAGFRKSPAGALLAVNCYSGDRAGTLSIVPGPAAAGDLLEVHILMHFSGWSPAICFKKTPPVILTHNSSRKSKELGT